MKDFLIYNSSDFNQGDLIGAEIIEDNLRNRFKNVNDESFNDSINTYWQKDVTIEDYLKQVSYSDADDMVSLNIEKNNTDMKLGESKFISLTTNFYDGEGAPVKLDTLTLNLSYFAFDSPEKEKTTIRVDGEEDSYQEIVFTNKGEVKLKSFHDEEGYYQDYVTDTSPDSVAPITSFINNEIDEAYLDFRVHDNIIYTRLRIKGGRSIWYEFHFDQGIKKLELRQDANKGSRHFVKKNLSVNNIYADGYSSGVIYKSEIIDAEDKDSIINHIELAGVASTEKIHNIPGDNIIELDIHAGNTIEDMRNNYVTVTTLPESGYFSLNEDSIDITGRYMQLFLRNPNRLFQNEIEYILMNYTPLSLLEDIKKQVDEYTLTADLSQPNIIEAETENFPFKIYVPEDANGPEEVTITRHREGEKFAEGMFGFEFDPIPELERYILIEVDYTGYSFNPYMSEEGLLVGYIDINGNPRQLDTVTFSEQNKILAYYL